ARQVKARAGAPAARRATPRTGGGSREARALRADRRLPERSGQAACREPRMCSDRDPSSARWRHRARRAARDTRERRGARSRSPDPEWSRRRCTRGAPGRVRASTSLRPGRRISPAARSSANPDLLTAIATDGPLLSIHLHAERVALRPVEHADRDPRSQPLRVEVLEKTGLVLELIGDPLDRRGSAARHRRKRPRRPRLHAWHGIAVWAGL